ACGWPTPAKEPTCPCPSHRTRPARRCCRCRPSTGWPTRCRWRVASIRIRRRTSTRSPRRSSVRACASRLHPLPSGRRRTGRARGARRRRSRAMTTTALVNARVLLDAGFADDVAVLLEAGRVRAVVEADDPVLRDATRLDLAGGLLVPGFIDAQVNGGGGVLFNNAPTLEGVAAIARAHRRFGTTGLLPTLISDRVEVMREAIAAVRDAIAQRVPGVLGIHLEGPYLAPARKGTHDAGMFRAPDADEIALATSLDNGVTLLTLAPEQLPAATLAALLARGAIVAAGHTAASHAQVRAGLDAGIRGFTHLFNAMSPLQGREPGAVGAALEDRDNWCGIIVDGVHVHPASLRVALAAKPRGKLFLVTDAMPMVGADDPA